MRFSDLKKKKKKKKKTSEIASTFVDLPRVGRKKDNL